MALNIQLDYEGVYEKTGVMLTKADELANYADMMENIIEPLMMNWQGAAASTMLSRFPDAKERMTQLSELVRENLGALNCATGKLVEIDRLLSMLFND